jgi:iron complex transport system substrate-binding protein
MRCLIALLTLAAALQAQPRRIVSTSPSITETLFALGLGDRVIGVSQHCHYPQEVASRPKVGSYLRPNVEAIVALRPDLVIVQSNAADAALQLERMKLSVLRVDHGDLNSTFGGIRLIAARSGVSPRGATLEHELRARLTAIAQRTARFPRRSLVFIVGRSPGTLDNLTAVGKASYLNELIDIAGGTNALAGAAMPYPKISLESMFALNPDVLIDMGDMAETVGVTDAHKRSVVAMWNRHAALKAVQQKRVFAVASDIFVVPGPRIVDAAEAFEKMLHPEAAR